LPCAHHVTTLCQMPNQNIVINFLLEHIELHRTARWAARTIDSRLSDLGNGYDLEIILWLSCFSLIFTSYFSQNNIQICYLTPGCSSSLHHLFFGRWMCHVLASGPSDLAVCCWLLVSLALCVSVMMTCRGELSSWHCLIWGSRAWLTRCRFPFEPFPCLPLKKFVITHKPLKN